MMERWQWKLAVEVSIVLAVAGWVSLMVSFWLPVQVAQQALFYTALSLGLPGLAGTVGLLCFKTELTTPARKMPLRCTDCGRRVINVGGEVMIVDKHPKSSSLDFWYEEDNKKGRWKG
jgi:hypothetical protein